MYQEGYFPVGRKFMYSAPLDFFARRPHFLDHLLPIWEALDAGIRGKFYVPECLAKYAYDRGVKNLRILTTRRRNQLVVDVPPTLSPILTSAYGDLMRAHLGNMNRPLFLMEHGVGLTFEQDHPGYAGGRGLRRNVALFLAPNEFISRKTHATYPQAHQIIIGTPKLDKWANNSLDAENGSQARPVASNGISGSKPKVAISFHWDGGAVCPEAGNALAHYQGAIPALAEKYDLIGHGHPKIIEKLAPLYESLGIRIERDFEKVMLEADIYVCDCSSTIYEFMVTGKPVVIMNAPWFRRHVYHGIRFWDYTDVGPMVESPDQLIPAIDRSLREDPYIDARKKAVADLYPYVGHSAQIAADGLLNFIKGVQDDKIKVEYSNRRR